jgi:hypothetical protein
MKTFDAFFTLLIIIQCVVLLGFWAVSRWR